MRHRSRDRGHSPIAAALLIVLASWSCSTIGSDKLVSSHTAYNDAVQLTVTREVLTNIVRSRYADPMQFLAVSSINAQFSVSTGGDLGIGGIGAAGSSGSAGATIGYSDSPTITYIPQSDAGFYKSFYGVLNVEEAIGWAQAYRYAGGDPRWQELSTRFSFASINGADDYVAGARNEAYDRRVDALVRLRQAGAQYRQIAEWDFGATNIAKEKLTSEDMVRAFDAGAYFVEEEGGEFVRLARYRLVIALTIPDPDDPEIHSDLEQLGVPPGLSSYVLRPPLHAVPGQSDPDALWVTPRSIGDALTLAARFVDVPTEHAGIVPMLKPDDAADGALPPVQIHSSLEEPDFPYRTQHRGYWFYVDDTEIGSKSFLEAMVAIYSSRVGSRQAGDDGPQIVLGVGG